MFFFHVLGGCSGRKTREGRERIEGVGAGVAAKGCLERKKGREGKEEREGSQAMGAKGGFYSFTPSFIVPSSLA